MRRLLPLLFLGLACLLLWSSLARAQDFALPGLAGDANRYAGALTARTPAGGSPQARKQAEDAAAAATKAADWTAAASAWEKRIGLGEATAAQWLALAQAQQRRTPPDAAHALQAAWQAFTRADGPAAEAPALLAMADALTTMNRPVQAIEALQAASDRLPEDARIRQALEQARRTAGVLVRRVQTEPDADPARACLTFTVAPTRRDDFQPQDWVRLDPPVPAAGVTREGDQICISGLPAGATTRVTLRAGLPGEGGLSLAKDTTLSIAMADKHPRVDFDTRLFLLPRDQVPAIGMTTVNLSSVKLTIVRLSERNVVAFIRATRLGQPVDLWTADQIKEETGRVIWEGSAPIPNWQPNRSTRTALPLPEAMQTAGPGLYALIVRAGDGTPNATAGVQMLLRTDFAPTVWRGSDGLTVQVRGYADVQPRAGVTLRLLAENNDVLAETIADADGVGRFAAPLLRGEGPVAPRAVEVLGGDDFTLLDLNAASFDLSDRGVTGLPHPGPLDAYVWSDRGIYRPGETVQVMALLRDAAGRPADIPARLIVKRPNGQVFQELTPPRLGDAALHVPVALSAGAPAGTWSVEVKADPGLPPIGRAEFRVDAFVPDRMAVDLGAISGPIVPGKPYRLPVTARFLYGAPASGLSGQAQMRLVLDPVPFPSLAGYALGLVDEAYAPDAKDLPLPDTDADGRTTLDIPLPRAPDTTHPLKLSVSVGVNDPSGHASLATTEIPVRPSGPLIGVKPAFTGGAVDAGAEAAFDVIAVNPDGARIPLQARVRLVRERPDWRVVMRGSLARYETVWRDEPLETRQVTIPADAPLRIARKLDFGRYRLEVLQQDGLAATSVRFRAGWIASDSPDVPDQVDVSADRKTYAPGETARIHIAPPFAGEATLLVLTDRVHTLRTLPVAAGGTDVEVPVSADWGPGAYVAVHVFRTAADAKARPGRAIGLTWVGIDPATRTLPLAFEVASKYDPRARAEIRLRTDPGAWVSLAAVDEGILRLTSFVSPDPTNHFLGRRRLGMDIRDDWGRLIPPPDAQATALRQGGDEGSFALPDIPQKTVTLFVPPVQAGADGLVTIPLDFPDFAGQVRLMAVAWSASRLGAAATDVLVRDPLVAEPLLPRFLAPGDVARLTVLLQNLELPAGEAVATVSVAGPLAVQGETRLAATLAPGARALPSTMLSATGAGRGSVRLDVTGPNGFHVQREAGITVRPARGAATIVAGAELPPNADATLTPAGGFLPGTWRASATFGSPVRYDVAGLVQALDRYAYWCLEQATSRGFPLALLPDGPLAGPDRAAKLQQAVASVLDRQRFDGGFALWSASGQAEPWLSLYATDFLQRARAAGATVPDQALADALKFVAQGADEAGDEPIDRATQPYRLYLLARADRGRPGAARVLAERIGRLPTPLAKAQLAATLALAHDRPRAEAAFAAALADTGRRWWGEDYGTALRDQAAIALLLKESGLLPDRLAALLTQMPGPDLVPEALSTQEQAWTAGAAAVLGRDARPVKLALNGTPQAEAPVITLPLSGTATVRNLGDRPVWRSVSATGVPATALPAARAQMRLTRKFLTLDGQPLDLDKLRQNTVFVLLLEGKAEDGQAHRALVQHGLPAGWELAGRLGPGDVPGLGWIGKLSDTEAQPAADDRYAAVIGLDAEHPDFRVAVRVRAVTPGTFELPGAEVADMYRPAVFARQNAGRITVQASE
ncbi:MAG: alpha-2-macroglobulin family protein [Rhodospirillales bacterium]|nr:alpha-2-macroglobulin family protein [Rhodospirillales bacterium]